MKEIIFILYIVLLTFSSFSQQKKIINLKSFSSFSPKVVYGIDLDRNQKLWIKTDIGLFCYNGTEFTRYSTLNGLPDNEVIDLVIDKNADVWISTFSSHLAFIKDETVYSEKNAKSITWPEFKNRVSYVKISKSIFGGVYAYANYNSNYFRLLNNRSIEYKLDSTVKIVDILECGKEDTIVVYSIHERLLVCRDHILQRDSVNNEHTPYKKTFYNKGYIYEFAYNDLENQNILDIFSINASVNPHNTARFKLGDLNNIIVGNNDSLYLFARNIVYQFNFHSLRFNPVDSLHDTNVHINQYFNDVVGNNIFSTAEKGIFIIPDKSIYSYAEKSPVFSECIYSMNLVNDIVFISAGNFLYALDTSLNLVSRVRLNTDKVKSVVSVSHDKTIVILNNNVHFYEYTRQHHFVPVKYKEYISTIKDAAWYSDSMLLIATAMNAHLYNFRSHKRETVIFPFRATRVECSASAAMIGTLNGLAYFDKSKKAYHYIKELDTKKITAIRYTPEGSLFFAATSADGIYVLQNDSVVFHITSQNTGLISNEIVDLKLSNNKLIINTVSGVTLLNLDFKRHQFKMQNFSIENGLPSNTINDIEIMNQNIYFALMVGLTSGTLNSNVLQKKLPLFIPSIQTAKRKYAELSSGIELPETENRIKVFFYAVSYGWSKPKYKYKMENVDLNWQTSENTFKEYGPLKPGRYTFKVYSINDEGMQTSDVESVTFSVLPRFYQILWIQLCALLCIALFIAYFVHRFIKVRKNKEIQKRHVLELELQTIRGQINPHFIFNSLASIQSYMNNNKIVESNIFISKFSKLIRQTLDYSKRSTIRLSDEIEYIRNYLYLEHSRFNDKFNYYINIDHDIMLEEVYVPPMISQLYIENAIIHGLRHKKTKGTLLISITEKNNNIVISIDDDGIGRMASGAIKNNLKESIGMSINNDRLEKYNQLNNSNVYVEIIDKMKENKESAGTTILINIPKV